MPPRIDLRRRDIANVVKAFYARVRVHPVLGPIFAAHVDDWPTHEEKITCFWANAILFERSYDGNPMQVHIQTGDVLPAHFEPWLALFDETLTELIASPQREQWSHLAHRIGRGLSFGVTDARCPVGSVPNLRNG
ncbi:group III truncated hemoglobin [Tateyamaria sp.]|uniref:group III truncated hemoglobin n=1 Tax=Tateyamaria sp. TaxID=1929288 RepID=UPI00329D7250